MKKHKVLQLANDYYGSVVYKNLFHNINSKRFLLKIIVVIRDDQKKLISKDIIKKYNSSSYNIISIFLNFFQSKYYRFFLLYRSSFISKKIEKNYLKKKISLIHAHTLFSNGGVAYMLNKKNNLNYIVAIRNVDVNFVLKYYPWQRKFAKKILLNAKHIIFISPSAKKNLISILNIDDIKQKIAQDSSVIPNGIDQFWIDNIIKRSDKIFKREINLIFVGEINPNKSIDLIIDSFIKIKSMFDKANLKVVGRNKPGFHKKYKKHIIKRCNLTKGVQYFGHISDKFELMNLYRESDIFIMPSRYETFGLVYIEAMSQGLPIIYTKNQGVDGFFKDGHVGYSVRLIESDIVNSIKKIIKYYNQISANCYNQSKIFSWHSISKKYEKIYSDII